MSRLRDIPIRIEGTQPDGAAPAAGSNGAPSEGTPGLGGGVAAILTELASLLDRLAQSSVTSAIDLRSLPMSPQDRSELQRALGEGEVQATVNGQGVSSFRETGVAGIWWVEHRSAQGELIAELLEVARVPPFLACAVDEIETAALTLREQLKVSAVLKQGKN